MIFRLLTVFLLCVAAVGSDHAGAAEAPFAFVNVNVLPMDSAVVLASQTVIIEDGRISRIGPADEIRLPLGTQEIRGDGLYLMPGLAEMHAHVPGLSDPDILDRILFLYIAHGITVIRGMLGAADHLDLRRQLALGHRLGPRLYTSGPSLNGSSVNGPADAGSKVRQQQAAGFDFIKLHPGLNLREFRAIDRVADQLGIPYAGHVGLLIGVPEALRLGQASIDHLDGYLQALIPKDTVYPEAADGLFGLGLAGLVDEALIEPLAKATAKAGVWIVPTQTLLEHWVLPPTAREMSERPEMAYFPAATVASWSNSKNAVLNDPGYDLANAERFIALRRKLIKALHEQGAGLLLGSDAPQVFNIPGVAAHQELELLVAAGLTPYQALRTGTVNPARYFDAEDQFGRIREGLSAELILLGGNPLLDITNTRNIRGVMIKGQWLDREQIRQGLEFWSAR
ncbi:MAG: amidohydrolase family protein [Gammaproteobacteria bacterium]|nr:amidohydrolase family protein [Gammaproteobacteria bacterium]